MTTLFPRYDVLTAQAANSTTFTQPPKLDRQTYPEALDHNYDKNGSHPHFVYSDAKTNSQVNITWRESTEATWRVANQVLKAKEGVENPKFAIMASSDSITHTTVIDGILRAGVEAFLVSHRMSAATVSEMLTAQGTTHIFVSRDPGLQTVANGVKEIMGDKAPVVLQMPTYEEIYNNEPVQRPPVQVPNLDDISIILHSSGSTSTPKRVPYTHKALLCLSIFPFHSQFDACMTVGWHVLPMFHVMGAGAMVTCTYAGATCAAYQPQFPPVATTTENALNTIKATGCDAVVLPPFVIHGLMASIPDKAIPVLASQKSVIFGGASLDKAVGDELVSKGVKLGVLYGMTETLYISDFFPKIVDGEDWDWVYPVQGRDIHFRDLEDGTFEPIYLENEYFVNNVNNTEINGVKGYSSSDVVELHPTIPNAFRVVGRVDDQIILSTGEKTNPVPLESILRSDPRIHDVITFGRGRPNGGIIIQPTEDYVFDGRDHKKLKEFRDAIAPTVKEMNDYAPTHSRLQKEMILVTNPDKPFQITAKGAIQRKHALKLYEDEINAAYEAYENSTDSDFKAPDEWTPASTIDFVRTVIHSTLTSKPNDGADVFQHGCDSLRSAWIRNTLVNGLSKEKAAEFPPEVLYSYPTIAQVSNRLYEIVSGSAASAEDTLTAQVAEMEAMLDKYATNLPQHTGTLPLPAQKTFLVTGTTGGLGSHLLDRLAGDPTVAAVYAVNRGAPESVLGRHVKAFTERALNLEQLQAGLASGKVRLIAADTAADKLGLSDELYDELKNSVTHTIHNAWPVNFNYGLSTFEPAVRGTRKLIELTLGSPYAEPHFHFLSSMATARNATPGKTTPEQYIDDPAKVVGMGYGASKWASETILRRAREQKPLRFISTRVGQLSGGANGNWNADEWAPSIIRSAKALNCLPNLEKSAVAWVRLHDAADSLLEFSQNSTHPTMHLVHPRPVPWSQAFGDLGKKLGVPLVPYAEWLDRVEKAQQDGVDAAQVPAIKILKFYRAMQGENGKDRFSSMENLATVESQKASPFMAAMAPINSSDTDGYVNYLTSSGAMA